MPEGGESTVTAVERAIRIIRVLGDTPHGASLAEISARSAMPKTTARRILMTLSPLGVVRSLPEAGSYCLGSLLVDLGERARVQLFSSVSVHAVLARLSLEAQETVHLATPDGHHLVYVDKVESSRSLAIRSRIGARAQLYCTGLGKAYLAFQEPSAIESYLSASPLERKTATTITDRELLRREMTVVRARGYALDEGENEEGVRCIAAPVLDNNGCSVAAISVTGPTTRMFDSRIAEIAPSVLASAEAIGEQIRTAREAAIPEVTRKSLK